MPPSPTARPRPLPRYRSIPYGKPHEPRWLDTLNSWVAKSQFKLIWIEDFRREEDNKATHIMTPVLTRTMYERPGENVQMHLRRAASNQEDAIDEAKKAVQSRLDGKVLLDFYGRVVDSGQEKSHCRYKVVDISYMCSLGDWTITDCRSEGATKSEARQKAAKRLLESGNLLYVCPEFGWGSVMYNFAATYAHNPRAWIRHTVPFYHRHNRR